MRHPTRSLIIGGIVILSALGFLIYQGLSNNLVYYMTPSEFLAQARGGGTYRLGGQVRPGSVRWHPATRTLSFVLQDPKASLSVTSNGAPPVLFKAGAGVVVEGTFSRHRFYATNLMIKHGDGYRAPKPGSTPPPSTFQGGGG